MRCALAPRSLRPTRELERTSMRLPAAGSSDAHHDVILEAEPERRRDRLDAPRALIRADDLPAERLRRLSRARECLRGRQRQLERRRSG